MHPNAQRVQTALQERNCESQVVELESSTRTAVEAAQSAGCEVGQIVKSLVFLLQPEGSKTGETGVPAGEPILALVSGANRVHEKHLGRLLGGTLTKADADFVREISGYAIGGVPPVGHKTPIATYIDEDLMQYDVIWAAAGTPNAVFKLTPQDLARITQGKIINVK